MSLFGVQCRLYALGHFNRRHIKREKNEQMTKMKKAGSCPEMQNAKCFGPWPSVVHFNGVEAKRQHQM